MTVRPIFVIVAVAAAASLGAFAAKDAVADPAVPRIGGDAIAGGFQFPEGPSLSSDGKYLYVVNVQKEFISRLGVVTGNLDLKWVSLPAPGRGNGAAMGPDGNLYVCDVGRKLIASVSTKTGEVTTIVDKDQDGKAFLGPNDITFAPDGGFYFTDPNGSSLKNPIGAVYHYDPKSKKIDQIATGMAYPNGLAIAKGGRFLLVNDTPKGDIVAIPLINNGIVAAVTHVFAHIEVGGPDGLRVDGDGNVYAAVYGGGMIVKFSPIGKELRRYPIDGGPNTTNLELDPKHKVMYVTQTSDNTICRVKL